MSTSAQSVVNPVWLGNSSPTLTRGWPGSGSAGPSRPFALLVWWRLASQHRFLPPMSNVGSRAWALKPGFLFF